MNWNELADHDVTVYSTPTCGDCRRLKSIFSRNNLQYTEVDIDADEAAATALVERTGHRAIPYVEVDGKALVKGWHKDHPNRWDEAKFFADIDAALAG